MSELLRMLLCLSVSGAVLAGLTWLAVRLLRGRLPHRAVVFLWLLVLARFCLPVCAPALPQRVAEPVQAALETVPALQTPVLQTDAPEQLSQAARPELLQLVVLLWSVGACAVLLWHIGGYVRLRRSILKTAREADDAAQALLASLAPTGRVHLVVSGQVRSPMLLGLLRPVIVIGEDCTGQTLEHVLLHELAHLRRGDVALKWLALAVVALHWFNPAAYLTRRALSHACELACDAAVIRTMDPAARRSYGQTLLLLAARDRAGALTAAMSRGKARLKERLMEIMKQNKRAAAPVTALLLALVLSVCGVLIGPAAAAPIAQNPAEPPAQLRHPLPAEAAITATFGTRIHPVLQTEKTHSGLDLAAEAGTPVTAAAAGTVLQAGYDATCGNYVLLDHGGGLTTQYNHLTDFAVAAGDVLAAGVVLGTVGQTGWATGPHLHFEVQRDGVPVDPLPLLGG